jgi:probable phosphomutase (TIGR03848 family)
MGISARPLLSGKQYGQTRWCARAASVPRRTCDGSVTKPYPRLVTLLLLVRHAVTDITGKRLYGRSEGISLSEVGRQQAADLARRLGEVPLDALYSSPLDRCLETASPIGEACGVKVTPLEGVLEIDYGSWTGRPFTSLRRLRLWREFHGANPSSPRFPGGETLLEAQRRAVEAVGELAERHPKATVAVVTHGDVVALVLAHYAGIHVDLFQRLEVAPASVTAIALGAGAPRIRRVNDTGTLGDLVQRRRARPVRG